MTKDLDEESEPRCNQHFCPMAKFKIYNIRKICQKITLITKNAAGSKGWKTEQIRRQRRETEMDGKCHRTHGNDREQAGMSREGRKMMEKVQENKVHDKAPAPVVSFPCFCPHSSVPSSWSVEVEVVAFGCAMVMC